MIVQLSKTDRIVMQYEAAHYALDGSVYKSVTAIVQDTEHDNVYNWMSRLPDSDRWDLHWRGNWKSTSDNFFEFTGDVEPDTAQVFAKEKHKSNITWDDISRDGLYDADDLKDLREAIEGWGIGGMARNVTPGQLYEVFSKPCSANSDDGTYLVEDWHEVSPRGVLEVLGVLPKARALNAPAPEEV